MALKGFQLDRLRCCVIIPKVGEGKRRGRPPALLDISSKKGFPDTCLPRAEPPLGVELLQNAPLCGFATSLSSLPHLSWVENRNDLEQTQAPAPWIYALEGRTAQREIKEIREHRGCHLVISARETGKQGEGWAAVM